MVVLPSLVLGLCALSGTASARPAGPSPFAPAVANQFHVANLPRVAAATQSPRDVAVALARQEYGLADAEIVVKDVVASTGGITHVYLRQAHRGIEIANADMNVNVDQSGAIVSYGSSFVRINPDTSSARRWSRTLPDLKPALALKYLASHLGRTVDVDVREVKTRDGVALKGVPFAKGDVAVGHAFLHDGKGNLLLTHRMNVDMEDNWYDVHVDTDQARVVSLIDWVADATYNVVKIGGNDPVSTPRELVVDPSHPGASPMGWHHNGTTSYTTSQGNNTTVQENWTALSDITNRQRPNGGAGLNFDFPLNLAAVDPKTYVFASATNAFYVVNVIHDIFHRYGFNEAAGNFQTNNWGIGGLGNDWVVTNVQDGSGVNNANFATPPDGTPGRMRLYNWTFTNPKRDSSFQNDLIIHEYGHGISNRLTGGPANVSCLGSGQAAGMGEGWGDFFSVALRMKSNDTSTRTLGMGGWVAGRSTIRTYMYSTSMTTNPTTYGHMTNATWTQAHNAGEIWANMLYEMYWQLMERTGNFNADWYSADLTSGNTLALALVVKGMMLQPCNPTFVQGRDAILQADVVLTGGQNRCPIWRAFAKRGLGVNAVAAPVASDFTLPPGC